MEGVPQKDMTGQVADIIYEAMRRQGRSSNSGQENTGDDEVI